MEYFLLHATSSSAVSPVTLAGAGVCCAVVVASWLINRRPQLLWNTQRVFKQPPLNIAHRGGQAERPENTLMAFRYAVNDCKCRMIELDVWLTKDGEVVVAHDDNLERVTGENVLIKKTNFASLPPVLNSEKLKNCHMEFVRDFSGFPEKFASQPIPRLEDVFKEFPDTIINVDIKSAGNTTAVYKTLELCRKYDRFNRTIFGGFDQPTLDLIKTTERNAIVSIGPKRAMLLLFAYHTGLLPFIPIWERAWGFPVVRYYFFLWLQKEGAQKWREKLPFRFLASFIEVVLYWYAWLAFKLTTNPGFIAALKRRGLVAFGWVANTPEEFHDGFYRVGCDGLMTDKPALLAEWIEKEGEKLSRRHDNPRSDEKKEL
ncbi:glycerophosphodiester phosphodiesterase family protein [Cystoisospora suis]|uniref:Glycerophosphodiester phosphodiesterase family protein n=1 Tax=Cystoisospora suis TaxID=483139 RepID=A0A2C6KJ06_9APIC|nr:glycerophosphodiester phosphodiesterase family protein [Cystoisospora suis]